MKWRLLAGLATVTTLFQSCSIHDSPTTDAETMFCYVTDMSNKTGFQSVPSTSSLEVVATHMEWGQPFLVRGVSDNWPAARLWSHAHFRQLFRGHDLFSSTFSTTEQPQFEDDEYPNKGIYYGIFLNNEALAAVVAKDYDYPHFIPDQLRLQGNEWIHWGHPPCGAKRHVDLTCTGRVSVQLRGSKRWRLYPPASPALNTTWSKVLQPLETALGPGDALVWFPGWEHETRIETGPSISLSLHFSMTFRSRFTAVFRDLLTEKIGRTCDWGS